MSIKLYRVCLSREEREYLNTIANTGKHNARKVIRAKVLLHLDEGPDGSGKTAEETRDSVGASLYMIAQIRRQFVLDGLEKALNDDSHSGRSKVFTEQEEAQLVSIVRSDPPEGHARWTLSLLAKKMVELGIVESISKETIRNILNKIQVRPWVTFRNHTLMSPDTITWLNQFSDQPINDQQRLALAYLRHNEQMTNGDYQRLNHVDSVSANKDLRKLVQLGLIEQNGMRGLAYYTLKSSTTAKVLLQAEEEKILEYIRENGSINNSECRELLHVDIQRASYRLQKLHKQKLLERKGERRWSRYFLME